MTTHFAIQTWLCGFRSVMSLLNCENVCSKRIYKSVRFHTGLLNYNKTSITSFGALFPRDEWVWSLSFSIVHR